MIHAHSERAPCLKLALRECRSRTTLFEGPQPGEGFRSDRAAQHLYQRAPVAIAEEHGAMLDDNAIDDLIEQINFGNASTGR
jgi:hypothetical protein